MVRGFARYLQTVDPDAQVPPAGLLPARTRRVTPYIYSDADIAALIGLLAATGMRGSEAMRPGGQAPLTPPPGW